MTKKLFIQAIFKFFAGVLLFGLLLFIPAGTLNYWKAWLLMGILFIPMFIAGVVMMFKNPYLLQRRLDVKEKENEQSLVIKLSGLMFILGLIAAGLSFRYHWMELPGWVSWTAAVVFLLAYALYAEVLRENTFLSRTIEVQENQTVVDTGLYGIVRHPMYGVTIILFLSIPLVLGSLISFAIFLVYPFIISRRIQNEEEVLEKGLAGYGEYKKKVIYKVIPFIW